MLPTFALGRAGAERQELNRLVLAGIKTATTSLLDDYAAEEEPLPVAGGRYRLIDSAESSVAILEVTRVRVCRFDEVDADHARREGEGFGAVTDWRAAHRSAWPSVTDESLVVLEEFVLVEPAVSVPSAITPAAG